MLCSGSTQKNPILLDFTQNALQLVLNIRWLFTGIYIWLLCIWHGIKHLQNIFETISWICCGSEILKYKILAICAKE